LSRIINPEGSGKERTRLSKEIVLSIRELMKQSEPDEKSRDLAAYISLALGEIGKTIDSSVTAWEKRGYWVKADRFRMEWAWTERLGNSMQQALVQDDWAGVAMASTQIALKLNSVQVSDRHRLGTPWVGAWNQLKKRV
jgi:hypothetical protein